MTDAGLPARLVKVGDINLNVIDIGEGPAVLLLHGFPDRALMWRHQIRDLSQAGYRVVAPDLRGFGDSDRPTQVEAYAVEHLIGDVLGLLATLGVQKLRIAAHDWGALLGWILASDLPDRVEHFVAISVGHPAAFAAAGLEQKQLGWYMLWWQFPGLAETQLPHHDWQWFRDWAYNGAHRSEDPDLDRQLTDLERPGALTSGLNWYRANMPPDRYALATTDVTLRHIRCPVMGIWGDRDMALTETQMTESARYVAGGWRYKRIHRVGHWIPTHAPQRTSEILLDFFGSATTSTVTA